MSKQWRFKKNKESFKVAYAKEKAIYNNKWKAFWEAMDSFCQGNIVYDFWWWFVWSNIKKVFGVPKKIHSRRRFKRERIKLGVASEDIWAWDENILEYFDNGFKMLIKQIWGDEVETWDNERWEEYKQSSWNKKFYDKIIDFQKNMEGLRDVRYEIEQLDYPKDHKFGDPLPEDYSRVLFELNNMETIAIESAWKNLTDILKNHHWSLWT